MIRGKWLPQPFAGVYLLDPFHHSDDRGEFVKTFHAGQVNEFGRSFEFREEFYSISHKNVLRGMHFQLPPHQHQKIVYCLTGSILDVLVDLRQSEPTYGKSLRFELSAANRLVLWIPPGMAHGFLSREDKTCVIYKTDHEYALESDSGIRWDSIDFSWKVDSPIVSARDRSFLKLTDFESPF